MPFARKKKNDDARRSTRQELFTLSRTGVSTRTTVFVERDHRESDTPLLSRTDLPDTHALKYKRFRRAFCLRIALVEDDIGEIRIIIARTRAYPHTFV